jgi:hypothetical protein
MRPAGRQLDSPVLEYHLKYFSELVKEVRYKNFVPALKHFNNPKYQIKNWFRRQIIDSSTGKESDKFSETFGVEIEYVLQEVRNISNMQLIRVFIEDYINLCDVINFHPGLYSNKATVTEIKLLKNRLIEVLNDNRKQINIASEAYFRSPSEDDQVIDRLGCILGILWLSCPQIGGQGIKIEN